MRGLDERTVACLDLTGSGNETAGHANEKGRMMMMFSAFNGRALTLRLYGNVDLIRPDNPDRPQPRLLFPEIPGTRQISA